MIQPLIRSMNMFLAIFYSLPLAIKNLLYLAGTLFIIALVFHVVHSSR